MNARMKGILTVCILILAAVGAYWFYIWRPDALHKDNEAARAATLAQLDDSIVAMARRYDAVVDWRDKVGKETALSRPLTIELKTALVIQGGRPVLMRAALKDIEEHQGEFRASFSMPLLDLFMPLYLRLQCTEELAKRLLEVHEKDFLSEFALIVRVDDLSRAVFTLRATKGGEGELEIEVTSGRTVIGTGVLLDFVYVGTPY